MEEQVESYVLAAVISTVEENILRRLLISRHNC